jgi:hypothetical protein
MTTRACALVLALSTAAAAAPLAQQPATAPAPQPPATAPAPQRTGQPAPALAIPPPQGTPPAPAPRRQAQPVNVKIDLAINDQRGGSPPVKRTLSMVVADLMGGSIRSQSEVMAVGSVPLNVDAMPELLADNKVRLNLTLQYDWPAPFEGGRDAPRGTVVKTALRDSVTLILENGKPMIAAQSADPLGDRQVTVEVKATILR